MGDDFILMVGNHKFLLRLEEAVEVARVLTSATRIEEEWLKDVPSGQRHVTKPPSLSAAYITPMTAYLRIEIDSNMKLMEEKAKS